MQNLIILPVLILALSACAPDTSSDTTTTTAPTTSTGGSSTSVTINTMDNKDSMTDNDEMMDKDDMMKDDTTTPSTTSSTSGQGGGVTSSNTTTTNTATTTISQPKDTTTTTPPPVDVAVDPGAYVEYSPAALANAFEEGKPVALFFHAQWCPTCKQLESDLKSDLGKIPDGTLVMQADFDTELDLRKTYNIRTQSTVVMLGKGGAVSTTLANPTAAVVIGQLQNLL